SRRRQDGEFVGPPRPALAGQAGEIDLRIEQLLEVHARPRQRWLLTSMTQPASTVARGRTIRSGHGRASPGSKTTRKRTSSGRTGWPSHDDRPRRDWSAPTPGPK